MLILITLIDTQLNSNCYEFYFSLLLFFTTKTSDIYLTYAYMEKCELSRQLSEKELVVLLRL